MTRQSFRVVALADRHAFIKLSDRIAFITRSLKRKGKNGRTAKVVCAYFGFSNEQEATAFIGGLKRYFPRCFCQLRKATRLGTAIEVKVRDFPSLETFIWKFADNAAIVSPAPITSEQARNDLQQNYPAQAVGSNVVSFTDRANSPIAHRTAAKTASNGFRTVSIE